MRLEKSEINAISELAKHHFGEEVRVFLFGSRTNDKMRGGDIDLLISKDDDSNLTMKSKIDFLTDLMIRIGEQKIDVVYENKARKGLLKSIQSNRIQLC